MPRHKPLPRPLRRKKEIRNLKIRLAKQQEELDKQKELITKYQDKIKSLKHELNASYKNRKDKIVPFKTKSVYRDEADKHLKVIYRIKNRTSIFGIDIFFVHYYNSVRDALLNAYNVLGSFKVEGSMKVLAQSRRTNESRELHLFTEIHTIMAPNEIRDTAIQEHFARELKNDFKHARRTSDMKIITIYWFEMDCVEYRPLNGGSYLTSPYRAMSLINIKNKDNLCFKYCLTAYFVLKQSPKLTNKCMPNHYRKPS